MSSTPILAQATTTGGGADILIGIAPWILIFGIFYLLLIRPQQKQQKQQRDSIAAVKKGDEVVTGGGHIGKVTKVAENEVEVEFASGQRHRVVKSMLSQVRSPGAGKPAND